MEYAGRVYRIEKRDPISLWLNPLAPAVTLAQHLSALPYLSAILIIDPVGNLRAKDSSILSYSTFLLFGSRITTQIYLSITHKLVYLMATANSINR